MRGLAGAWALLALLAPQLAEAFLVSPQAASSLLVGARRALPLQPRWDRRAASLSLRSQQQAEDTTNTEFKESGRQRTAALFEPKAPFPPSWLLPFLVPATGGALFGYDIGATSAVTRILGENAGSLGELGAGEIGFIASGSLFGAMAASTLLIVIGDKQIGRKLKHYRAAFEVGLGHVHEE